MAGSTDVSNRSLDGAGDDVLSLLHQPLRLFDPALVLGEVAVAQCGIGIGKGIGSLIEQLFGGAAAGCRLRLTRLAGAAAEHQVEGSFERRGPLHLISADHDHPLELREASAFGLEEYRLHVDNRVLYGHHQHVTPDHLRPLVVPQGELLGDDRVLLYALSHLFGAIDQLPLGHPEVDEPAIASRGGVRDQEAGHVLLVAGGEGL